MSPTAAIIDSQSAKGTQRMARPIRKQFPRVYLSSLHQRIRSQDRNPSKDGDPGVPSLIKGPASSAILRRRLSGHGDSQAISCVHTRRLRLATPGRLPRTDPVYAAANPPATNAVSLRNNAQAIRTSLLASATTTVLPCARLSRPRSQLPSGVAVLDIEGRATADPRNHRPSSRPSNPTASSPPLGADPSVRLSARGSNLMFGAHAFRQR